MEKGSERGMISLVVAASSAFLSRVFDISREITRAAGNTRSQEAHGTTTKNRTAGVDIADILGVTEANVLMLLMVLNLTLGMVIITSTKFPHLHLLV